MLTKKRILELLGNAPEKLERWEQEVKILKGLDKPTVTIVLYLIKYKIPYKKHLRELYTKKKLDSLKKDFANLNIKDKQQLIDLITKYKTTYHSLHETNKRNVTRLSPISIKEIVDFYKDYIYKNGKTRGWRTALLSKLKMSESSLHYKMKKYNIILPQLGTATKEKVTIFLELVENLKKEEVYTQYQSCYDYIVEKMREKYPAITVQNIRNIRLRTNTSDFNKSYVQLQKEYIVNLLKNKDKNISNQEQASIWAKKYPMRKASYYRTLLTKPHKIKKLTSSNECKLKNYNSVEAFIQALPSDLTEEQKKQIIKAYEKASY